MLSDELSELFSLDGRVAIVTGAARGLGAEIARTLAGAGATVVAADVLTDPGPGGAGDTPARYLDVSSQAQVGALVADVVAEHGRLDVMVNNAGIIVNTPAIDTSEEEFDRVLAVNLKGVLFGCQAAARVMVEAGRGSIVNIASQAADSPAAGVFAYAVSKAGVVQLTRNLATELGPLGVRVNAVASGFTPTPMTNRHFTGADGSIDEAARDQVWGAMTAMLPLGVLGEPRDHALAVLYLASDAARFVTGQVVRPNGGGYMG